MDHTGFSGVEPGIMLRTSKDPEIIEMLSRPWILKGPTAQGEVLSKVDTLRDLMKNDLPHADLLKSVTRDLSALVHKQTGKMPDLTGAQSQKFIVDWVKEGVNAPQARKVVEELMNPLMKGAGNAQFNLESALARAKTPFYKMPKNATLPTPANMNLPKWFPY
jgi:hypothetical protein